MTLAGNMKLKNFVVLVAVAGVAGIGGLYWACGKDGHKSSPAPAATTPTVAEPQPAPVAVLPPDAAAPVEGSTLAARPYDAEVLSWQGRSIEGGKQKDVTRGKPYKISVYQDAGKSAVNRVKVDANRNNKWDDKYTFDGPTITLEHAPADDESYTQKFHWSGSAWTKAE